MLWLCLITTHSPAQSYTVLHTFGSGRDGATPWSLLQSGTNLYGTTADGGVYAKGNIFRINADGSGYTVLKDFAASDGAAYPTIVLSGTTLYGTLCYGGSNHLGALFKIGTEGNDFSLLHVFSDVAEGEYPNGCLTLLDTTLYGMTSSTIFKVDTDGSGFAVLKNITGGYFQSPAPSMVSSGDTLYGTTVKGGSSGYGTVFKINIDGTGYTLLKDFNGGTDGGYPSGPLLIGTTLYGTCNGGGSSRLGTVFKINTDGTGFTVIKNFNDDDGKLPAAALIASGATLYGTTSAGGGNSDGNIFQINADGTGFAVLKSFTGKDGANPYTTLVADGTTLHGATSYGGGLNCGVLFSFSLLPGPPPDPFINTQPESQSVNAEDSVEFYVVASGTPPLRYQWFKNGIGLTDGGTISGAQTANLLLSSLFGDAGGAYSVIVTNLRGSATSQVATLSVADPFFRTQPFSQTVYIDSTVQFTGVAGGTAPIGYQWLKDGGVLSDGGNISGAQTPTLTMIGVSTNDVGNYALVITNVFGSLTSSPALLNVTAVPSGPDTLVVAEISGDGSGSGYADYVRFTFEADFPHRDEIFGTFLFTTNDVGRLFPVTQAEDTNFNDLVSILKNGLPDWVGYMIRTVNGDGTGGGFGMSTLEANFFSPLPSGSNGIDLQGFPIDNITLLFERLVLTHPNSDLTDLSFNAKLFVNARPWPPPAILVPPASQTAEIGAAVTFGVRASSVTMPLQYQWCFGSSAIAGCTNRTLRLSSVQVSDAGAYKVIISNSFGSVTSPPAALQVIPSVERRRVPGIHLTADAGSAMNIEYAESLAPVPAWFSLDTVTMASGSQFYFDATGPLPPRRLYRGWQSGTPSLPPTLELHFVPAITLAGKIADSLRVDYINQIGLTDAWVTLNTVTLTNTTQLYFDVSAIGQPQRLYRLVPVP